MKVNEHKIEVQRTGVYFQAGNLDTALVNWFVCHGYGQLAENMIRKFDELADLGHSILSIEALNRFYWEGVTGQPAATWMTKRFRLEEIKDNNVYLSRVFSLVQKSNKKVLLGFSQGGTTMWRWIHEKRPEFDVFINYAGWMPEDIDLSELGDYLSDKKLIFTYGSKDEYLTEDRIKLFQAVLDRSNLNVEIYKTDGGHRVERSVLAYLFQKYIGD